MGQIENIKNRFEYWKLSRGSYILSANYIKELEEFLFTGQSETIGQGYDEKRRY